MTWEYKMQQGNHNVCQSMHRVQTCGEYDMSIEHDMCEHNQQIWRLIRGCPIFTEDLLYVVNQRHLKGTKETLDPNQQRCRVKDN